MQNLKARHFKPFEFFDYTPCVACHPVARLPEVILVTDLLKASGREGDDEARRYDCLSPLFMFCPRHFKVTCPVRAVLSLQEARSSRTRAESASALARSPSKLS